MVINKTVAIKHQTFNPKIEHKTSCHLWFSCFENSYPHDIYLLKTNDRNIRTRCEICSKLTINTLERLVKGLAVEYFQEKLYRKCHCTKNEVSH